MDPVRQVEPDEVFSTIRQLQSEGFDFLTDLTAADYPAREPRFDVFYILYSFSRNERVWVRTRTSTAVPTIVPLFEAANWLEREVFDMFGIVFPGHPDLKRILLPEGWDGYPLRKDYSIVLQDEPWVREHLGIESGQ